MTRVAPSRRNYRNATGGYGRWAVLQSLGPVVYAVRMDDGIIKIGFTTDLADRERKFRKATKGRSELLAFRPGTFADEQAIHATLTKHRAHGREWYHPTEPVLAVVDEMRAALGLSSRR